MTAFDAYDGAEDSYRSWALAVAAQREQGVREGRFAPTAARERRQASEGPVPVNRLDCLKPALCMFSGDFCPDCGSAAMLRSGTCLTCQDCGSMSGGCS